MISVIYSDKFLLHKTSDRHPERPERLQAVTQALKKQAGDLNIQWVEPTYRDLRSYLSRFHSSIYLQKVEDMANQGGGNFYEDTFVSPDSFDVAMWLSGNRGVKCYY